MALTVDELLVTLKKSRLLSEKQLGLVKDGVRRARKSNSAKPLTAESVTRKLVRESLITEWHQKMLLQKQSSFHLGQYVLQEAIGKGGMGKVFKAQDRKNNRDVAIKVLSGKLAKKPKLVARFRREVEVASRIDSPYIVKAFDAGEVGASHFMVMEYVEGESFEEVADRLGRMRTGHACELIRQAALGLKFANEQGMVHRDIKPANIMVAFENELPVVRLLDMGLARFEKAENDGMTKAGQVMGTPDYMAPEQGWNTADVDVRADIYSLGCTFFRLVTGQVPFPGDNPLQVLMARCSIDAPLASSLVPDIDPRVDAIVRRMTWRDPSQRYQTPEELLEAITPLCLVPSADDLTAGQGLEALPAAPTMVMDSTPQEPSFQEFLRDVGSGGDVTLMQGSSASFPGIDPGDPAGRSSKHQPPPTRKWPFIASAALIVSLLVLGAIILFPRGNHPEPGPNAVGGPPRTSPPKTNYFAEIPVQRAEAGQVVGFFAAPALQEGLEGVTWELGKNAPEGADLTPATGSFTWPTPSDQEPGRVSITLLAKRGDRIEAEQEVFIDFHAIALNAKIIEFANLQITSGELWEHQIRLFGVGEIPPDAKFVLAGGPPNGLALDEQSGLLTWTPPTTVFGTVPLSLQLIDRRTDRIVHNAACSVLVRPSTSTTPPRRQLKLPTVTAQVGQLLVTDLRANRQLPTRIRWVLTEPGRRKGAKLDPTTGRFEWTPSDDMVGKQPFEIELTRDQKTVRRASFVVNVAKATPKPADVPTTNLPSEEEIAAAEKEIRQLYKRDFASRSTTTKRQLAMRLLMRSYADKADAMQFALLKLALATAEDSRAYGCGCEVAQQLQAAFGVDSVETVIGLVGGFRVRNVAKVDLALLGEGMFREGLIAAKSGRFGSTQNLMKVANTIARKGAYAPITERALQLLKALPAEDPEGSQQQQLDSKQQLAADELVEMLTRYQFQPIFRNASAVRLVRSTGADADAGRGLWKFTDSSIGLKSPAVDLVTGFIDPAFNLESFVLRMHLKADTTSAVLVFGASGSGQTGGYQIPLVGTMEFSINQTEPSELLAKAQGRVVHDKSGWDLVELAVMGKAVAISVNGNLVTEAQLPERASGTVGILTNLRKAGEHQVYIRRVRLLETPEQ